VTPGPITTNYGYEYENRLTSVSNPSYTAAYTYSADGLRLRAQESNHQYADRWFLYAGALPFCEGTLSGDTHSLCAQGRLYTSNKIYIREGLSYYDPLVFSSVGGYRRHYLYDGLGSTRQLLNDAQNTTDTYSYEAFGNSIGSSGTTSNPYKYVGSLGYYSPSAAGGSSLQHLGARYYLPELGRFLGPDPLPQQWNNDYAYAGNSPTTWVDPNGQWWAWVHAHWSEEAGSIGGLSKRGYTIVGQAAYDIDDVNTVGLLPHFGTSFESQTEYAERMKAEALSLWSCGDYEGALAFLGFGLHALQDNEAHGMGRWHHLGNGWVDDPLLNPDKARAAQHASKDYVKDFVTWAGRLKGKWGKKYLK